MSCVIVTGAGRGIGQAIAWRLARDGWQVVAVDVDESSLAATASSTERVHPVTADISAPAAAARLVREAAEHVGEVDVLVNNAAVSLGESFLETRRQTWQRTLDVNLTGTFACGQAFARWLVEHRRPGRIINLASANSYAAERGAASYVASKGGVLSLTRAMAVDLAPYGILVTAVAPGPIRTSHTAPVFDAPPVRDGIARGVPLGRAGTPEEVAGAVAFLAGADATFVTGTALVVDGGYLGYARFD
ncbi:MAG: SDR family NAD(P)-dependent oxidoreductase [bacterium]